MTTLRFVFAGISMNQTICSLKCVASWTFCALVFGFLSQSFGQTTLPPLESVNVPNFTIPFEVEKSANSIREVELLVSKDRGKRWHSVARQPVESEKFAFRADSDGEYWFAFRKIAATGNPLPLQGHPHLRVAVNTEGAASLPPSQPSQSGPVTPPKPERFMGGKVPQPQPPREEPPREKPPREEPQPEKPSPEKPPSEKPSLEKTDESVAVRPPARFPTLPEERTMNIQEDNEENGRKEDRKTALFAPKLPGFDPTEMERKETGNLLDDLLSRMSPFMDVQPVELKRVLPDIHVATPAPNTHLQGTSQPSAEPLAGSIAWIDLNTASTKPQVVVQWHTGHELWRDAQIDILRGGTKEGPWSPIAINLINSGEYWWFLTPEDLKPFHVAVRIRSFRGGTQMDITRYAITIDPARLVTVQSAQSL